MLQSKKPADFILSTAIHGAYGVSSRQLATPGPLQFLIRDLLQGYISQVQTLLANRLLATHGWDESQGATLDIGLYAYDPSKTKLAYRTIRAQRDGQGSTKITTRPSPGQAEQTSLLDRQGNLIERVLPNGHTLVRTNKKHIKALWSNR